jgi:Fe2+ transport system protein FeoA
MKSRMLKQGQAFLIQGFEQDAQIVWQQKMASMGFVQGQRVDILRVLSWMGLVICHVMGSTLILRTKEMAWLHLKQL